MPRVRVRRSEEINRGLGRVGGALGQPELIPFRSMEKGTEQTGTTAESSMAAGAVGRPKKRVGRIGGGASERPDRGGRIRVTDD